MAYFRAVDETGRELAADFSIEPQVDDTAIILESRGGRTASQGSRNPDYEKTLGLILRRLAARGSHLLDATVESRIATGLPTAQVVWILGPAATGTHSGE